MKKIKTPKISVVGIGGGGCNTISLMTNKDFNQALLIAMNTDIKSLDITNSTKKIQLGKISTKGLGSGMNPSIGEMSAIESYEEIKESLKDSDIVFIVSAFGGGTGTGASPLVAKACKEIDAIVISLITMPFTWEGKKRENFSKLYVEEMQRDSDLLIVISNDKLLGILSEEVNMRRAFKLIDDILFQTVKTLIDKIIAQNSDINSISKILKQKFFVLNYNDCTLGASVACNSLNKMEEVENIHINFDEKDLSVIATNSSFIKSL
jgi:cell division protein FtsZ